MKHSTWRRIAAGAVTCLTSVGALSFATAMPAHAVTTPQLERILGRANGPNEWDDEVRLDFVLRVPAGDPINTIEYNYHYDLASWWTTNPSTSTGTGQDFQIVNRVNVGADDLVAITLRGDTDIDVSCPSQSVTGTIKVHAGSGNLQFSDPMAWTVYNETSSCPGTSRPIMRLPWDNGWGAPSGNSQSGFGAITTTGIIANTTNSFVLEAENINRNTPNDCGVTDSFSYQWVHEDNTPSNLTPTPVAVSVTLPQTVVLGTQNFTSDSPGYYKLLAWPNAHNSTTGPDCSARTFTPGDVNDAFQVGSVFYNFNPASTVVPMTGNNNSTVVVVGGMTASLLAGAWLLMRRRQIAVPGEF